DLVEYAEVVSPLEELRIVQWHGVRDARSIRGHDEPLRIFERQRFQKRRMHDAEDRRGRADAERKRRDDHGGEPRRAFQQAEREPGVLKKMCHGASPRGARDLSVPARTACERRTNRLPPVPAAGAGVAIVRRAIREFLGEITKRELALIGRKRLCEQPDGQAGRHQMSPSPSTISPNARHACAIARRPAGSRTKCLRRRPPRWGVGSPTRDRTSPLVSSRSSVTYTALMARSRPVRASISRRIVAPYASGPSRTSASSTSCSNSPRTGSSFPI